MKVVKLVFGILTIVISAFVLFQSCAAGVANTLSENGESSGTGGLLVALLMLSGGIVMIASRKNISAGGSIAGMVLFILAALIGFPSAGSYKDLKVWSVLCLILAVINLIALLTRKKDSASNTTSNEASNQNE